MGNRMDLVREPPSVRVEPSFAFRDRRDLRSDSDRNRIYSLADGLAAKSDLGTQSALRTMIHDQRNQPAIPSGGVLRAARRLQLKALLAMIVLAASAAFAQDSNGYDAVAQPEPSATNTSAFPRTGTVINPNPDATPGGIVLVVRETPPVVTPTYQLGKEICRVRSGTEFVAIQGLQLANGEIWYKIEISKLVPCEESICKKVCPATPFSGWMIGRFGGGTNVVSLTDIPNPSASRVTRDIKEDVTPTQEDALANGERPGVFHYLMTFVGALVGMLFISVERTKEPSLAAFTRLTFSVFYLLRSVLMGVLAVVFAIAVLTIIPDDTSAILLESDLAKDVVNTGKTLLAFQPVGFFLYGFFTPLVLLLFVPKVQEMKADK